MEIYKLSEDPYIIAEIGNNHNGEYDLAIQMIDDAKKVGCNSVKFQSWDMDLWANEIYEEDPDLKIAAQKYLLPFHSLSKLKKYCDDINIDFSSSIFIKTIKRACLT